MAKRGLIITVVALALVGAHGRAQVLSGARPANQSNIPGPARAAGYLNETLDTENWSTVGAFDSAKNFAPASGGSPSAQWFVDRFFSFTSANDPTWTINTDGSITITASADNPNYQALIGTASAASPTTWVGTAYGGGFYAEAEIKFNESSNDPSGHAYPAWWDDPVEHLTTQSPPQDVWPATSGTFPDLEHWVEDDFAEFKFSVSQNGNSVYNAGPIDWWGQYNSTNTYCDVKPFCKVSGGVNRQYPPGFLFSGYHWYGYLYVPATATSPGIRQYFLDGVLQGSANTWTQFICSTTAPGTVASGNPGPTGQAWLFGGSDCQHYVLFFGGGFSTGAPQTVLAVHVWQKDASQNLVQ